MKNFSSWESELIKLEITAGLESSLDQSFRRVIETARAVWERKFAGQDPSGACVSVRIATNAKPEVQSTAGNDLVRSSQTLAPKPSLAPHFAH